MHRNRDGSGPQGLYGAVLGGLTASFVALVVFWQFLERDSGDGSAGAALFAVLVGLSCSIAFMAGGAYATERRPWLGSSLLFASGFTALWCVGMSFGAEPRWAVLVALGFAITTGVFIGWHHFGREPKLPAVNQEEVVWTP